MSVLIKGMKMPKSCSECRMLEGNRDDGLCHAAERWLDDEEYWRWFIFEEGDIDDSMPSNCPLIELPDHGDLVDRDALMEHECYVPFQIGNLPVIYRSYVKNAPVVIPAEGSEDVPV